MSNLQETIQALLGNGDPMPFGVGGPAEPAVAAPAMVTHAIEQAATLPKRALGNSQFAVDTGHYDPKVPVEAAMSLGGSGIPLAEQNAAGIFGGRLSLKANLKALQEAERMKAGGKYADDIWQDTGWGQMPTDNKWRFEIPDSKSQMLYMPQKEAGFGNGPVDAILKHPELYRAYPDVRYLDAQLTKDSSRPQGSGLFGRTAEDKPATWVGAPNPAVARSVFNHELQHWVQAKEGFAPGINPRYYAERIEKGLRQNPEIAKGYDFDAIKSQADNLYHRTAGEVEARNVQNRLDWDAKKRRDIPPWYSQDVSFQDQLVFDPVTEMVRELKRPK